MSAGPFVNSAYEDDEGNVYNIRVQPETLLATLSAVNAGASGAITMPISARARGSKRMIGVSARTVRVRFSATPPTGYSPRSVVSIPVLTPAVYNATNNKTTGLIYLSSPVEFVGKTAESIR